MVDFVIENQAEIAKNYLQFFVEKLAEDALVSMKLKKANNADQRFASLGCWEWGDRFDRSLRRGGLPFFKHLQQPYAETIKTTKLLIKEEKDPVELERLQNLLHSQNMIFAGMFGENYSDAQRQ